MNNKPSNFNQPSPGERLGPHEPRVLRDALNKMDSSVQMTGMTEVVWKQFFEQPAVAQQPVRHDISLAATQHADQLAYLAANRARNEAEINAVAYPQSAGLNMNDAGPEGLNQDWDTIQQDIARSAVNDAYNKAPNAAPQNVFAPAPLTEQDLGTQDQWGLAS